MSISDPDLEQLIGKISTEDGLDVRGYKRTTLCRRLRRRLADVGADTVQDYLVRLERDPHEYALLLDAILINVTGFFRDPEAWEFLRRDCLPALLRNKWSGEPLRTWSAGCATGEEAYTIAICLAESLGESSPRAVKIYATDVDGGALASARAGVYSPDAVSGVPPELMDRYFDELPGGRYTIRREVRSSVIFGRHNVLTDPPMSRLDLLVCRNVLIYFDRDTQRHLFPCFHYALREEGLLFLGRAETLMARSPLFRPLDPRHRIFQRLPRSAGPEAVVALSPPSVAGRNSRTTGEAHAACRVERVPSAFGDQELIHLRTPLRQAGEPEPDRLREANPLGL